MIIKNMMKIFVMVFLSFLIFSAAFADESEDWGNIMDSYKGAEFNKIISNPEYKDALKTRENLAKKAKKNKKKDKDVPSEELNLSGVNNSISNFDVSDPLLVLPTDVFYENKIIKQGFYLVSMKNNGEKYFLELKQGKQAPIAVIEATGSEGIGKNNLKPQVSIENVDDKTIKINYTGQNLILEAFLWKYFN